MADRSTAQFVGGIGSIMSTAVVKSFDISKNEVWEAYRQVRANKGAAGADGVSIGGFESDLKGNLYKIWNRMSSGSYMPPAVLAVEIPKSGGGVRVLGVLTVADRIAQTVVANRLSVKVEPVFHPDSYGYRPGALGVGCGRGHAAAVLEQELGCRCRHRRVLRQCRSSPAPESGRRSHRGSVGAALCQAVAVRAAATR
jgi:hypothetical protein